MFLEHMLTIRSPAVASSVLGTACWRKQASAWSLLAVARIIWGLRLGVTYPNCAASALPRPSKGSGLGAIVTGDTD